MNNDLIYSKISALPENLKAEVVDFIDFLLSKIQEPVITVNSKKPQPKFGSGKGTFDLKPGWDEPLTEELKDYM
ncbi:MAG: DUF2281 domain-containing protein [Bacteroidetes bacterium]|nr:DUF2281 domain-containing protein [Bacteroidota bacterium]